MHVCVCVYSMCLYKKVFYLFIASYYFTLSTLSTWLEIVCVCICACKQSFARLYFVYISVFFGLGRNLWKVRLICNLFVYFFVSLRCVFDLEMKFHKSIYSLCCLYVITVCICRGLLKCWQIWHVKCFCTFPLKGKGAPPSCPLSLSLLILLTLTALLPWLLILFCVVSLLDLSLSLEIWLVFRAGWKRIQAYNLIWVLTSNQKRREKRRISQTAIKTMNSDKRNKLKGRGRDTERETERGRERREWREAQKLSQCRHVTDSCPVSCTLSHCTSLCPSHCPTVHSVNCGE